MRWLNKELAELCKPWPDRMVGPCHNSDHPSQGIQVFHSSRVHCTGPKQFTPMIGGGFLRGRNAGRMWLDIDRTKKFTQFFVSQRWRTELCNDPVDDDGPRGDRCYPHVGDLVCKDPAPSSVELGLRETIKYRCV